MKIRTPRKINWSNEIFCDLKLTYLLRLIKLNQQTLEILEEFISNHISIELRNFGLFKSKYMKSRFGSNPRNKRKIYIPSKWKVTFKASASLNKKLNEKT